MRFSKRVKIAPGLKLNVGLRGVSTTVGRPGASVNLGKRGTSVTVGIPGTGISHTKRLTSSNEASTATDTHETSPEPGKGADVFGTLLGILLLLATGWAFIKALAYLLF